MSTKTDIAEPQQFKSATPKASRTPPTYSGIVKKSLKSKAHSPTLGISYTGIKIAHTVPSINDEFKKTLLITIFNNMRQKCIILGSGAISLYLHQKSELKFHTSYRYMEYAIHDKITDTNEVEVDCYERDLDIVTYDAAKLVEILHNYGNIKHSSSVNYSTLLSNRNVKSIHSYTIDLLNYKDYTRTSVLDILTLLIKMYNVPKSLNISIDIIEITKPVKRESMRTHFSHISKTWPVSNLMRNFYFNVDESGRLEPHMFTRPKYNITITPKIIKTIGLTDMIEYLKYIIYFFNNIVPKHTSSGDAYERTESVPNCFVNKRGELTSERILINALKYKCNPIINPMLKLIKIPYVKFNSSEFNFKNITKIFKLSRKAASLALKSVASENSCVCIEKFYKDTPVYIMKCGHVMHMQCFAKHYIQKMIYRLNMLSTRILTTHSNNHMCPYCRTEFDTLPLVLRYMNTNDLYFGCEDLMYPIEEIEKHTPFKLV